MVWLLPSNIQTIRPSTKLYSKTIEPFNITAKVGSNAYKLDLPPSMRIHNTFHISVLELYEDNEFPSQIQEPPPFIQIEGEDEYELKEIMDSRLHYNKLQYRAKLTSYSPEHEKVWYPARNFEHATDAIKRVHHCYPQKPRRDNDNRNQKLQQPTNPRRSQVGGRRGKALIERANKEEDSYAGMSWTACYYDECLVHMSEKDGVL